MLEEALSSTTYPPAEAAQAFMSFLEVELAAGGASAESRFFKLFSLLCHRLFGELSKEEGFNHVAGGWLGRHVKWERPRTSLNSPHRARMPHRPPSSSGSVETDPVVKLLGTSSITRTRASKQQPLTIIEAFAKEAEHRPNVRYSFPFEAFPKSTQDAWLAIIEEALRGTPARGKSISENARRLLGSLLRVKPLEQVSLRHHQHQMTELNGQHRALQLSPMQFQTRQPMSPLAVQTSTTPIKDKDSTTTINISMLEYYLVMFLRYPLAPPSSQSQPGLTKTVRSEVPAPTTRRTEPYGDSVYYQLFQEYTNYYVPSNVPQGHATNFSLLQRPAELFVRIIVEFWLDSPNATLWTTEKAVKAFQQRSPQSPVDLNTSFELVKTSYSPSPFQVTRCLHKLVTRAITDGVILDAAMDMFAGHMGDRPEVSCLSPTMAILQLPIYNHIRSSFRHASIHAIQSPFYAALNDWLVWLEPWNTRHDHGRIQAQRIIDSVSRPHVGTPMSRLTYPKGTHYSMYRDYWEPYIAANLHLYTVPLAIFLRRSRELDFSPREFQRSLNTVRRVLRVFSPEVVAVINKLLKREPGARWAAVALRHEGSLGEFAPPACERGLASCQDDMQNLLEEMYSQHMKKVDSMDVFDRIIARIEGVFGGGAATGEEKELRQVIAQAKRVVGFPADFDIIHKSRAFMDAQSRGLDKGEMLDRAINGYFSAKGIERISSGRSKCNPFEIGYVGDRIQSRPQSFEIGCLIPLLVNMSKFLNAHFGIHANSVEGFDDYHSILPRRFNLRFLADKRNLLFLFISFWLLRKMILP